MADGFYTNDEDYRGCFGGYGSDGADQSTVKFADGFATRTMSVERAANAGGYGVEAASRFRGFGRSTRSNCEGGYGRAA